MRRAFVVGLVGLVVGVAVARAQSAPEPRPLLVGVIDMGVAFSKYKKKDDLEKEINAQKTKFEKKGAEQQAELQALRDALGQMTAGTDEFRKKRLEFNTKAAEYKAVRDDWEDQLKVRVESMTLELLKDIEGEVSALAKEKNYDLILKTDSKGWGDERFQERIFRAQVATVVYRKEALDVTDAVVERLNAKKK